jgi:hypothetical protein
VDRVVATCRHDHVCCRKPAGEGEESQDPVLGLPCADPVSLRSFGTSLDIRADEPALDTEFGSQTMREARETLLRLCVPCSDRQKESCVSRYAHLLACLLSRKRLGSEQHRWNGQGRHAQRLETARWRLGPEDELERAQGLEDRWVKVEGLRHKTRDQPRRDISLELGKLAHDPAREDVCHEEAGSWKPVKPTSSLFSKSIEALGFDIGK